LPLAEAREIVKELNDLTSVTWNIYSDLSWLTQKPKTQALLAEEKIVKLCAKAIDVSEIENLKCIHKVWVMGPKNILDELLKIYSQRYSNLYLVKSKDTLLEIVASGVEKADSIK
ncbi:HAD hydrolase family protein, partial [Klebsiella pneumoniae]